MNCEVIIVLDTSLPLYGGGSGFASYVCVCVHTFVICCLPLSAFGHHFVASGRFGDPFRSFCGARGPLWAGLACHGRLGLARAILQVFSKIACPRPVLKCSACTQNVALRNSSGNHLQSPQSGERPQLPTSLHSPGIGSRAFKKTPPNYIVPCCAFAHASFEEGEHTTQLRPDGEWLVGDLPGVGTIRLKLAASGSEVVSNFQG